jgi:SAM-dependent methyltransferase
MQLVDRRLTVRIHRLRQRLGGSVDNLAQAIRPAPSLADIVEERVGGAWNEIGRLQFDYMRSQGLNPADVFLDLGCGVLRGGRHFISYLDSGNYYGIDADQDTIRVAHEVVTKHGLTSRQPQLRLTEDFDIEFDRRFDFGLALSVFTHLPVNSIYRALVAVADTFREGGTFYASYFPGPCDRGRLLPIAHPAKAGHPRITTYADANPYHYAFEDFQKIVGRLPLRVENLGDWSHPRGQHMLRFTRAE